MKIRLLLLSILLISSPHAAAMFEQLIQIGVNSVVKGIQKGIQKGADDKAVDGKAVDGKAVGVTDHVTKSSLRDCDEKDNYWDNCYGEPVSKGAGYYGEYQKNMFNGQGTLNFENGNKYVGVFKDNHLHGQATLTFANGDKYVGIYKKDLAIGQGTLTKRDGTVIVGTNVNGKFTTSTQDVKSAKSWKSLEIWGNYNNNPRVEFLYEVLRGEKEAKKFRNDYRAKARAYTGIKGHDETGYECMISYIDSMNTKYKVGHPSDLARLEKERSNLVKRDKTWDKEIYIYPEGSPRWYNLPYLKNLDSSLSDVQVKQIMERVCEGIRQDFLEHEAPIIDANAGEKSKEIKAYDTKVTPKKRAHAANEKELDLKKLYEAYFLIRACNDLDTKYISNSQLKKTKKAIRSLDDQAKKQGVDTDKVYKDAETNPSESTNNSLAMVKTIKLLGGANFNPQLRTMCMGQSNILILLAEGDKAKKQKGKKDF